MPATFETLEDRRCHFGRKMRHHDGSLPRLEVLHDLRDVLGVHFVENLAHLIGGLAQEVLEIRADEGREAHRARA